jgi:hypothetical protein
VSCIVWVGVCGDGRSGGSFLVEVATEQARSKASIGKGERKEWKAFLLLGHIDGKDRILEEDVSPGYTESSYSQTFSMNI